ncbi:hypothetical protein Bca101_015664 [Brassica carinata]
MPLREESEHEPGNSQQKRGICDEHSIRAIDDYLITTTRRNHASWNLRRWSSPPAHNLLSSDENHWNSHDSEEEEDIHDDTTTDQQTSFFCRLITEPTPEKTTGAWKEANMNLRVQKRFRETKHMVGWTDYV